MKTRLGALLLPVWMALASAGVIILVNALSPPPTWDYVEGRVTRYQERVSELSDPEYLRNAPPVALLAASMVAGLIELTGVHGGLGGMRNDIFVYALLWPLLMAALTSWAFWPLRSNRRIQPPLSAAWLLLLPLSDEQARWLYLYLCDFIINSANLFGIGYLEMNGWFFGVLFPGYSVAMVVVGCVRRINTRAGVRASP